MRYEYEPDELETLRELEELLASHFGITMQAEEYNSVTLRFYGPGKPQGVANGGVLKTVTLRIESIVSSDRPECLICGETEGLKPAEVTYRVKREKKPIPHVGHGFLCPDCYCPK